MVADSNLKSSNVSRTENFVGNKASNRFPDEVEVAAGRNSLRRDLEDMLGNALDAWVASRAGEDAAHICMVVECRHLVAKKENKMGNMSIDE